MMTALQRKTKPEPQPRVASERQTKLLAGLALFGALNFATLDWLGPTNAPLNRSSFAESNYLSPMYGTWTWWMARCFVREEAAPDVVLLGSSQVNSPSWAADACLTKKPVDCLDHREVFALEQSIKSSLALTQSPKVMNCAVQGGMASDYYMIERTLFQEGHKPKVVVVCVSPRDFIDNKLSAASSTEPFRFFSRFMDAGKLAQLAYTDPVARFFAALDNATSRVPLRRLNELIANRFASLQEAEKKNSPKRGEELAQAISNGHQQVKLGEWVVPADMKSVFVDNTAEYQKRYGNPKPASYQIQMTFFRELMRDLNGQGYSVLVVEMPTLPGNQSLLPQAFWQEFRGSLQSICQDTGTQLADLSKDPDFEKQDYLDTVHLNGRGGLKFFNKLGAIISGDKKAVARLLNSSSIAAQGRTY
jgi:hypothetical protein